MRLLLDTHVLLATMDEGSSRLPASYDRLLDQQGTRLLASVASLWEIAIKFRQGKLELQAPLEQLPNRLSIGGIRLIDVTAEQALHEVAPLPDTRDPFDRLLLAVARLEGAMLMTLDRRLLVHPLAWRPTSA